MRCFIGVDLGSTTTKAVVLDENIEMLGRGITNSRSNYDTACRVARHEALIDTRFTLVRRGLAAHPEIGGDVGGFLAGLDRSFRLEQFVDQLADLAETCRVHTRPERFRDTGSAIREAIDAVFARLRDEAPD